MSRFLSLLAIAVTTIFLAGTAVAGEPETTASAPDALWCVQPITVGWGTHNVTTPQICVPGP
jgi:hypothetical protein